MKRKGTLDFLFPLALFTIFIIISSLLLTISIEGYHNVEARGKEQDNMIISSYLTTKIRANDNGMILLSTRDGIEYLTMQEKIDNETYVTYIFYHDGYLKELLMQKDLQVNPKSGTKIMKVKEYHMQLKEQVFQFSYQGNNNKIYSQVVALQGNS